MVVVFFDDKYVGKHFTTFVLHLKALLLLRAGINDKILVLRKGVLP